MYTVMLYNVGCFLLIAYTVYLFRKGYTMHVTGNKRAHVCYTSRIVKYPQCTLLYTRCNSLQPDGIVYTDYVYLFVVPLGIVLLCVLQFRKGVLSLSRICN